MPESISPHAYQTVREQLRQRLQGDAVGVVQLLTGPRQVGKTTLLLELAEEWKERGIYTAADAPEAALPGWWENLWERAERNAEGGAALLLIDEIQYLQHWERLLKNKVDQLKRHRLPLRVVATGSSALSLGRGSRETMAGRFERLRLLHWPAAELARCFHLERTVAACRVVQCGGYPGAVALWEDRARWRAYIRDSIIEPAIGRDMLAIEAIRKPALLRQVFAVATGHPAEIISLQKLCGQLSASGALETVAHYLHLLEEACLVAALPKYSGKVLRQRAAPPKLIVLNNAVLAATTEASPSPGQDPERWGRWLENACLAFAWNCGQQLSYWREEPLELDLVTEGSWGNWAIEVKSGAYSTRDLASLFEFCRRYPRFRPLVICASDQKRAAQSAGIHAVSWEDFLWEGVGTPT